MSVLKKPAAADADEPTSATSGMKPELAGMSVKQRLEKFKSDMETLPKNQRGLHIRKYFTQLEMSGMYQKLKGKIKRIGGKLADEWQENNEKQGRDSGKTVVTQNILGIHLCVPEEDFEDKSGNHTIVMNDIETTYMLNMLKTC